MNESFVYIIAIVIVLIGIIGSIRDAFIDKSIKDNFKKLVYYLSTLLSFTIIITNLDLFYEIILKLINDVLAVQRFISLFKVIFLAVGYILVHFIIYTVLYFIISPIIKFCSEKIDGNKVILTLVSGIFGMFKGIIFVFLIFFCLMAFNRTIGINNPISLKDINSTDKSSITSSNKNIISENDLSDILKGDNVKIYYNGVTLEEGIKSNDEINNKSQRLIKWDKTSKAKAKSIYQWIGENIKYDYDKAEKALGNKKISNSGAIAAWEERSGICFDYACLYVAMAREAGLQVRLITGMASDGETYGPHAWNEVYIQEEDRWINIDPTFYNAGNYFDNNNFFDDHQKEHVAGEW